MSRTKILVVDDEVKIRELVKAYLQKEGFTVEESGNGREAVGKVRAAGYDAIVLDLMMPDMDGLELCREIRKESDVPIIMLTAKGEEIDRILGLELGADDYMVKPFSPRELVARIKAVLRRVKKGGASGKTQALIEAGDLRINESTREVTLNGEAVALTPKEYDLILCLARYPGRVFTREQLLEQVWGYDFFGEARTVDTHITRLREKLAKAGGSHQYIATVWGIGYKFEVQH
ncbi:MAG: response regulator transcription factor [Peptococcaceae bacterium]|nr:response regulator transcription factor [Peptococcaceae bacterium]